MFKWPGIDKGISCITFQHVTYHLTTQSPTSEFHVIPFMSKMYCFVQPVDVCMLKNFQPLGRGFAPWPVQGLCPWPNGDSATRPPLYAIHWAYHTKILSPALQLNRRADFLYNIKKWRWRCSIFCSQITCTIYSWCWPSIALCVCSVSERFLNGTSAHNRLFSATKLL